MIKYLRLPIQFSPSSMLEEISHLPGMNWKMHYNKKHYEGDWSVIALRSPGGSTDNIFAIHASATTAGKPSYEDTILLSQCPTISTVLRYFECEITMVRLMKLNAGAVIKPHTDHDMCFEAGEARFHIPLQTNEQVDFFIEEEKIPMKEGECWYLNLNLSHRVTNAGNSDRIHLVIDCMVNDWVRTKFAMPGLHKKEIIAAAKPAYSKETRNEIIAALRLLNTPVANEIAHKMQLE
jgi:mannose-6-phosphate isomerase-like protein (cupin superfamily)